MKPHQPRIAVPHRLGPAAVAVLRIACHSRTSRLHAAPALWSQHVRALSIDSLHAEGIAMPTSVGSKPGGAAQNPVTIASDILARQIHRALAAKRQPPPAQGPRLGEAAALQMTRDDFEDRRERQRQGIELAKARGKYVGRQADLVTHERIIVFRSGGNSISRIGEADRLQRSAVKRVWARHQKESGK